LWIDGEADGRISACLINDPELITHVALLSLRLQIQARKLEDVSAYNCHHCTFFDYRTMHCFFVAFLSAVVEAA